MPRPRKPTSPFRYLNSSPEVIRLAVLMYVRFPLSLGCWHDQPIRWIVVWQYQHGKSLGMDTFRGAPMPKSVKDAGFCGIYFYFRK